MDHDTPYTNDYIAQIFADVQTIAIVGAHANPRRPAYHVMQFLMEQGYDVIPINVGMAGGTLLGLPVYRSLLDVDRPIDMVDVFRPSAQLDDIAKDAIQIGARVLWGQLDIASSTAAKTAEDARLRVVMNRCPIIEFRNDAMVRMLSQYRAV